MNSPPTPAVTVYSTAFCPPCDRLKAHLGELGVAFTLRDPMMDEEAAEFLESRHLRTTPVLTVGDTVVVGFDPAEVDGVLRSAGLLT